MIRIKRNKLEILWFTLFFWGLAVSLFLVSDGLGLGLGISEHNLGTRFEVIAVLEGFWFLVVSFWWISHRKFDIFEYPTWIAINVYIQVIFNVLIFSRDFKPFSYRLLTVDYAHYMMLAVVLIGFGVTCLWIGYSWTMIHLERRFPTVNQTNLKPNFDRIVFFWGFTSAIYALSVLAGVFGYLSDGSVWINYYSIISSMGDLVTFILLLYHFQKPTLVGWVWTAAAIALNIGLSLAIGSRGSFFILLNVLMASFYATRKLQIRWIWIGVVAVIFTAPIATLFRQNLTGHPVTSFTERLVLLQDAQYQAQGQSFSSLTNQVLDLFRDRQGALLEITAASIATHPNERGYIGSDILETVFETLIPRVVWITKPVGADPIYDITGLYWTDKLQLSLSTIGPFGDAYRAGGWLFTGIWFVGLGVCTAILYHYGPASENVAITALYLTLITSSLRYDRDIARMIVRSIHVLVPGLFLIYFVLFEPQKKSNQSQRTSSEAETSYRA